MRVDSLEAKALRNLDGELRGYARSAERTLAGRAFCDSPVLEFVDMADLPACSRTCKLWNTEVYAKRQLSFRFETRPVPSSMRPVIWKKLLLGERQFCTIGTYRILRCRPSACDAAIKRDLHRTFPGTPYFDHRKGQQQLHTILRCVSHFLPDVGYCQGMNFVAGMLLLVWQDTYVAFQAFLSLLLTYGLKEVYAPSLQRVQLACLQFERLVDIFLPRVSARLRALRVPASLFCTQWFMTLFATSFGKEDVMLVWDRFLLREWTALYEVGLGMLHAKHDEILHAEYENVIRLLKAQAAAGAREVIDAGASFRLTARALAHPSEAAVLNRKAHARGPTMSGPTLIGRIFGRCMHDTVQVAEVVAAPANSRYGNTSAAARPTSEQKKESLSPLTYSSDGSTLATGGADGEMRCISSLTAQWALAARGDASPLSIFVRSRTEDGGLQAACWDQPGVSSEGTTETRHPKTHRGAGRVLRRGVKLRIGQLAARSNLWRRARRQSK
eukprot:Polyplicarium_translucidae@DN2970_c0_g1_i3.p1